MSISVYKVPNFVYTFVGHQYLMLSEYSGNFVRKYNINND